MAISIFSEDRVSRAERAIDLAIPFLEKRNYPLGISWVQHRWRGGPARSVTDALSAYQQPDGGFSGLEVDIKAPVSNAFAGRLAMQVLLSLSERPDAAMTQALGTWYAVNQHADGDWHFPPEVYEHGLAPWFANWTFPSLNPSCCIAGLTHELDIATPELLARVATIWEERSSLDQAESGNFYLMLPIIEYVAHIDVDDRDVWLESLVKGIERGIASNSFGDAEHALEHIVGGGPDLVSRIDNGDLGKVIDAVLADQRSDGGWPTPYDDAWRPWTTANLLVLLSQVSEI